MQLSDDVARASVQACIQRWAEQGTANIELEDAPGGGPEWIYNRDNGAYCWFYGHNSMLSGKEYGDTVRVALCDWRNDAGSVMVSASWKGMCPSCGDELGGSDGACWQCHRWNHAMREFHNHGTLIGDATFYKGH